MRIGPRRLWLQLHGWLGLSAGLLFVLLGLTGSALVFDHAIDEWLNPELLRTTGQGPRCSIEEITAAAESAFGPSSQAVSVTRPRVADGVWTVWFSSGSEDDPKFAAVYVDPHSADVTGQRVWGEDLMTWLYRLHFRLLGGSLGGTVVGLLGILLVVSLGSGIYLWWPLWKNGYRAAFAIRSGARLSFDLHKVLGTVSAVLLLVVAFTGVAMEFPVALRAIAARFAEVSRPPTGLKSSISGAANPLTPDEALALARQRFPHATFDHLHPPASSDGVYEVAFRQPGEVQRSFGRSQVFLDAYTGQILQVRTPEDDSAADTFFAWQFPLHNGEALGLVGRWLVFLLGFVPAVLYVTGLALWWRKRRSRRRQKSVAAVRREGVATTAAHQGLRTTLMQ